jgi:5-methylcytosine-specific restriction endonuclease McrA
MREGKRGSYSYKRPEPKQKRTKHTYVKRFGNFLAQRDGGWFCFYCFIPLKRAKLGRPRKVAYLRGLGYGIATVDHRQPTSKGGKTVPENLVLCCHECNERKGDSTYTAFIRMLELQYALKSCDQSHQSQSQGR